MVFLSETFSIKCKFEIIAHNVDGLAQAAWFNVFSGAGPLMRLLFLGPSQHASGLR